MVTEKEKNLEYVHQIQPPEVFEKNYYRIVPITTGGLAGVAVDFWLTLNDFLKKDRQPIFRLTGYNSWPLFSRPSWFFMSDAKNRSLELGITSFEVTPSID